MLIYIITVSTEHKALDVIYPKREDQQYLSCRIAQTYLVQEFGQRVCCQRPLGLQVEHGAVRRLTRAAFA